MRSLCVGENSPEEKREEEEEGTAIKSRPERERERGEEKNFSCFLKHLRPLTTILRTLLYYILHTTAEREANMKGNCTRGKIPTYVSVQCSSSSRLG